MGLPASWRTASDSFRILLRAADDEATLSLSGELDLATAPLLREALAPVVAGDCATVIIDLGDVTFIDSTGLGVLIGTHRRLADASRRLLVLHPTSATRRVVEIAGLDRLLDIR